MYAPQTEPHGGATRAIWILFRPGHLACRSLSMDEQAAGPSGDRVCTVRPQSCCSRAPRPHTLNHQAPTVSPLRRLRSRTSSIEAAQRFAIPASWIRAVMRVESFGDPRALSPKGAMGLMQIMPDTWSELRSRHGLGADPYDPHDNIIAGAAYLRELHDRYGEAWVPCGLQCRPQALRGPSHDRSTASGRDGSLHGSSRLADRRPQ